VVQALGGFRRSSGVDLDPPGLDGQAVAHPPGQQLPDPGQGFAATGTRIEQADHGLAPLDLDVQKVGDRFRDLQWCGVELPLLLCG
jgi:hypothetical protein